MFEVWFEGVLDHQAGLVWSNLFDVIFLFHLVVPLSSMVYS